MFEFSGVHVHVKRKVLISNNFCILPSWLEIKAARDDKNKRRRQFWSNNKNLRFFRMRARKSRRREHSSNRESRPNAAMTRHAGRQKVQHSIRGLAIMTRWELCMLYYCTRTHTQTVYDEK